ncbi:MAG TPA: GlyGly-CTERM sorting domain-containing protein, partial [Rheinheimera sp.]|nr:GlyGly-CTERM sorting domain-containing protein [Rheinheimera sp.]
LVYHLLPKANADLKIRSDITETGIQYVLRNDGAITTQPFTAQLVATSAKNEVPQDLRAATLDVVPVDYCSSGYLLVPSFTLDRPLSHMLQANFAFLLDSDNDENFDYEILSLLLTRLDDGYPVGYVGSFTVPFGELSGFTGDAYHVTGQRNVTLTACLEEVGLTAADIGKEVSVAYLSFNDGYNLGFASGSIDYDDLIYTTTKLALSPQVALTNANGEAVTEIAPGQSAVLNWNTQSGFVLLSDVGDAIAVADLAAGDKAPVVTADQVFNVEENAADGTVIGKVDAEVDFSSPVAEFVLAGSNSNALTVASNGDIVVSNSALLNYDAGLTEVQLEVVALDTAGNVSAPAMVTVNINNLADETPVVSVSLTKASVDIGTAAGMSLGTVAVDITEAGATVASLSSNNGLFAVVNNQLVLARTPTKSDVKTHNVVVTATDSSGMTGTASVSVTVNKPSSGSFGWFSLLALPLLLLRRKRS